MVAALEAGSNPALRMATRSRYADGMNDDVYRRQGFGHQAGLGERPALLIVDFINGFADPQEFGGGNILEAIDCTRPLLAHARAARWPVAFTRVVYAADGSDAGVFCLK